jgi:nicotinamide-nucleotide amidase
VTDANLAARLVMMCRARGVTVATAESCTGGMIAAAITAIPGSSAVLDRGFVTYSNAAKTEMLGVPEGLIAAVGAVSEAVAARMAEGAKKRAGVEIAVSVTGIAGPDGGSEENRLVRPGQPKGRGAGAPQNVQWRPRRHSRRRDEPCLNPAAGGHGNMSQTT